MISEADIRKLVESVIKGMENNDSYQGKIREEMDSGEHEVWLQDIGRIDLKSTIYLDNPGDREGLLRIKQSTPARIGVWRAGPRYRTETMLRFRADHGEAMDSVFTDVSQEFLQEMNMFSVKTMCSSKDEHLTRPDLGRKFDDDAMRTIREKCIKNPQVQIYVSDGLSSKAIEANVGDVLPAIIYGLEGYGIKAGTPFFVKYGRTPSMDVISEITGAEVTCVLIGERPGLITSESMSAYIAYRAEVGMKEARRTVVSNIHKGGTVPVEAGAYIADIIRLMLEKKASGIDLKL
jgi:ethanolamine ammonia-lyase small subunit